MSALINFSWNQLNPILLVSIVHSSKRFVCACATFPAARVYSCYHVGVGSFSLISNSFVKLSLPLPKKGPNFTHSNICASFKGPRSWYITNTTNRNQNAHKYVHDHTIQYCIFLKNPNAILPIIQQPTGYTRNPIIAVCSFVPSTHLRYHHLWNYTTEVVLSLSATYQNFCLVRVLLR
jgi:hypothetical protein